MFAIIYGESPNRTVTSPAKKYPASGHPTAATPRQKGGAMDFLAARRAQGATSLKDDLLAALKSAAKLASRRKTVIYVGDGYLGSRSDYLQVAREITRTNIAKARIHTIGVTPYAESEAFLKALAAMNRGTYKRVD